MRIRTARAVLVALALINASCSDSIGPRSLASLKGTRARLDATAQSLPPVRISEIHYDNTGTDVGEAIEVSGPAETSLVGWSIVLYNGNGGASYDTKTLSGTIPASCDARGVVVVSYPSNGIQNGSPDGVALIDPTGGVVEFLSYEGTFAAVGGPANGVVSADIGVAENGTEVVGLSLQRDPSGTWHAPAASSFGTCNDNNGGVVVGPISSIIVTPSPVTIAPNATQQFVATAADANGSPVTGATFTWSSDAEGVATVDGTGLATGVLVGDATITAMANGIGGSATLHVRQTGTTLPETRFSELHYDNVGTDAGEAIEIEGPAGTSIVGWSIALYDGNGDTLYKSTSLTGSIPATCAPRGVVVVNYPVNGIQNGSPDGMALVDAAGHVVEFLSYEGVFKATNGPAAGLTSTDIGASEASSSPIGQSLQRDANNVWMLQAASLGACNATGGGQSNVITFSGRDPASDPPLPIGFEDQLFATLHSNGTVVNTTFTWSSDTPAIASIDANGVARALTPGTAILRATAADGATGTISLQMTDAAPSTTAQYGDNIEFGQPRDADPSDDFIIQRPEYTISYNANRGTPNWVSYDLDASHFGADVDRCDCFTFDPALPAGFTHLTTADYTGAGAVAGYGIDRGHLVRSFDRTSGALDNAYTYYLSNIVPQASDLNQGPWAAMENFLGDLARFSEKEVYIIAGVAGSKGTVKNEGKIVIPAQTWKVAVILPRDRGLADVHRLSDLEVVAVVMPNVAGVRNVDWHSYEVTVDSVEALTGYDLLDKLPDAIEIPLEANDHAPVAAISGATSGFEGTPLSLSGESSTDEDRGDVLSYAWDFGDGTTGNGRNPMHSYVDNDTYTVHLTVTDKYGLSSSTETNVSIRNAAPVVQLSSTETKVVSGMPFTVHGTFADAGVRDAPWSYTFSWGDGSAKSGQTSSMSAPIDATMTFMRAGSYTLTFAVTDKDGGTCTSTLVINVARQSVSARALPGIINLNDRGQGGIDVALLSGPGFDPSRVNPRTATIGGVGLDTHDAADKLSYHYADLNHDGVADVVLRFGRAALIDAGLLKSNSTELKLLADLLDGTQIEGRAPIETHLIGKAN